MVAIVIRDRFGLPLIYKDSYKLNELDLSILGIASTNSLGAGSIIAFNVNIV
jgi:hypothetical protein